MEKKSLDKLIEKRVSWLADSGPEDDIAISSRIRLARNLKDLPFPINAKQDQLCSVTAAVLIAAEKSKCFEIFYEFKMSDLTPLERQILLERRLISRDFAVSNHESAVVINEDETCGLMINEEDHIRMQVMRPGLQLLDVWKIADKIDNLLTAELPIAFDQNLGYLTSCPTNVGTGMRASVMLHLPGLTLAGQINGVIQAISKLGLAARGIFGEGTENLGNLYQISNQSTLGETETQIIEKLESVLRQIIGHEKNARQKLMENRNDFLLDHIGRAYGILKHSYIISSEEALNSLSSLRLGVDMGMFSSLDIHTVNELFVTVQSAHLQKYANKELNAAERDVLRAKIIREKMNAR